MTTHSNKFSILNQDYKWNIIAGPCAAESSKQILETAIFLKKHKINVLRAGIWKPRSNPTSWQGSGDKAIQWMLKAREKTGIKIATEVIDESSLNKIIKAKFDYIWIGTRNGQNYSLIKRIGELTKSTKTPIILKRSMSASLDEWLGAAEYITKNNQNVILCERGIRTFSTDTRNVLDLQTAWLAKSKSKLPVIIDISHAAGRRDLIIPMAKASKACGLNGIMVEVHPCPKKAKTDAKQQISFTQFNKLIKNIQLIPPNNFKNN